MDQQTIDSIIGIGMVNGHDYTILDNSKILPTLASVDAALSKRGMHLRDFDFCFIYINAVTSPAGIAPPSTHLLLKHPGTHRALDTDLGDWTGDAQWTEIANLYPIPPVPPAAVPIQSVPATPPPAHALPTQPIGAEIPNKPGHFYALDGIGYAEGTVMPLPSGSGTAIKVLNVWNGPFGASVFPYWKAQ